MRKFLVLLGVIAIAIYAVTGALLMNNWTITAASGVSLETAKNAMANADKGYSSAYGYVFAVLGIGLAVGWAAFVNKAANRAPA